MAEPSSTRESLSKTPSWIMLGVIVGATIAWYGRERFDLRQAAEAATREAEQKAAKAAEPAPPPPKPAVRLSLPEMEAVFDDWQQHATWLNGLTEVVFWNPNTQQYSDAVEILKSGDENYFRSIPKLTRPLVEDNVNPGAPLRFTEPESVHAEKRRPFIIGPRNP
jgi:hypothetical protein